MQWAVLTGDIVDSSDLAPEQLDRVLAELSDISRDISVWPNAPTAPIQTGFARRGGDGWQIALDHPKLALRAALYVVARLHAAQPPIQSRIAVASGAGSLPNAPDRDLNSAHGPAFTASGRALTDMPRKSRITHAAGGAIAAVFHLADHISRGWTGPQAQAVALMLVPEAGPRRRAAEQLGITRQAVDQALHAAGFPALERAMDLIEADNA